jgi:hypothetical protein
MLLPPLTIEVGDRFVVDAVGAFVTVAADEPCGSFADSDNALAESALDAVSRDLNCDELLAVVIQERGGARGRG